MQLAMLSRSQFQPAIDPLTDIAYPGSKGAPPPAPVWIASTGATVRGTLEEWAKHAGWTVVWPMDDLDYPIGAPLHFDGSLVDVVGQLTRLYESADRPFRVAIHPDQKVMVFAELTPGATVRLPVQTLGASR